jgi:integrase
MAKVRDARLENRTARRRLEARLKPYWVRVAPTIWLGYRALQQPPGSWNVGGDSKRWIRRIAWADDLEDANGKSVMSFWQAQDAAKKLARGEDDAVGDRPITVAEALDTYARDLEARGGGAYNAKRARKHLQGNVILSTPVAVLTERELKLWRDALIANELAAATVNRTMVCLHAALEAAADGDPRIIRRPWRTALRRLPDATNVRRVVKPDGDIRKIAAACYEVDRQLGILCEVLGTCGMRLSQASRLTVADLQAGPNPRLLVPKSGKGNLRKRNERMAVPIPASLAALLQQQAANRPPDAPLLCKSDGTKWQHTNDADHRELFRAAVARAGFDPDEITTYCFRHSSIVRQLIANVPIRIVAATHDTSVGQIERCYSRYVTDHSDALTRAALIDLSTPATGSNIVPLGRKPKELGA